MKELKTTIRDRQNVKILERNSRHYHAYRHAVQAVLDAVPDNYPVPVGLGYALGVLREVHEEAEGEA